MQEKIISHIAYNKHSGDIYISVSRDSTLYRDILNAIKQNGDSTRNLRVVVQICGYTIGKLKIEPTI